MSHNATCFWCSDCTEIFECGGSHSDHNVIEVGGDDVDRTILALDEIINFGMDKIKGREEEANQATLVKADIETIRNEYIDNSKKRIDRIDQDLRVAMDYSASQLLKEGNKKMGDMELKCQSVITTSRVKMDSLKGFIQEAALTLPDDEGRLDPKQLQKLYAYFKTVHKMENQARPRIEYVDFSIKYPDSYQRKKGCQDLADDVCGELDDYPSGGHSSGKPLWMLEAEGIDPDHAEELENTVSEMEMVPIKDLKKPKRKVSRDMLRN